jgi:hypothetical protein
MARHVGIDLAKRPEEDAFRPKISMKEYLQKERNGAINRLYRLYGQIRIIDVTKQDLEDPEGRVARHGDLPRELRGQAAILEGMGSNELTPSGSWLIYCEASQNSVFSKQAVSALPRSAV